MRVFAVGRGSVWIRRFSSLATCTWLSCNVPLSAIMSGVYAVFSAPMAPDFVSPVMWEESVFDIGEEGTRQERGASLWI